MSDARAPSALDLFCGGGGASQGLHDAGFYLHGVDTNPRALAEYPFECEQRDALEALRSRGLTDQFDLIWASPPCQAYSTASRDRSKYPDLIAEVRELLQATGKPYVIENVLGAKRHLRDPIMLQGPMFGLGVIRRRLFECSWPCTAPPRVPYKGGIVTGEYVTVAGNGGVPSWTLKEREKRGLPRHIPGEMTLERWQEAMGIDWLSRKPLTQAIPPAYAEWIGRDFLRWREAPKQLPLRF